jgi:hypothetical protein
MLIHLTSDIRHLIKLSFNTLKYTRDLDALSPMYRLAEAFTIHQNRALGIPPFSLAKHGECAWLTIPSFPHAIHRSLTPAAGIPWLKAEVSSSCLFACAGRVNETIYPAGIC